MNETIILPDSIKRSETPALPLAGFSSCATSEVYLMDCVEGLRHYPDNYFDLAVVDPPYGINATKMKLGEGGGKYRKLKTYKRGEWDAKAPDLEYFYELFRASKNQIVWGANHFISKMPYDSSCWIFWDKNNGDTSFADGELAWTSFKMPVRSYKFTWSGFIQGKMGDLKESRIHPTQKPAALYDWVFSKFSEKRWRVLDTHLGSGSSRIAANKAGLDFVGFEIDNEYFEAQEKRWQNWVSQTRLF